MPPEPPVDLQKVIALIAVGAALMLKLNQKRLELAAKIPPDPWPPGVDVAVRAREATPVCTSCLYPQEGHHWFCPHCGFPTGDYVTSMPYLHIFAIGEVLRRGVLGPPEKGFAQKAFLVLYSAGEYIVFAPIYWFWMARKAMGKPICRARREDLKFEDDV